MGLGAFPVAFGSPASSPRMSTSGQRASLLTSSFEAVVATGEGPEAAPWARTTSRQRQMRAMRVRGFIISWVA